MKLGFVVVTALLMSSATFAQNVKKAPKAEDINLPKGETEVTAEELAAMLQSGELVEQPKAASDPVHTYTHGPLSYSGNDAAFITLDGNPADCGIGYCGLVQVRGGENPWWGIETPQVWGFPNGGFNVNNTVFPLTAGPFTFTKPGCNLTTDGCVDYSETPVTLVDYGLGEDYDETVFYQVHKHVACRTRCYVWYTNDSTNGSGTTSYTPQ